MTDLHEIVARLEPLLGPASGAPAALSGGITNRNYRVRFGDLDYVVRLPGKDTALLGISRETERLANESAAGLGIAPAVAAALEDCLVTRYVSCREVSAEELRAAPQEAATALRRFHEGGARLPTRFSVPQLLDSYAQIVRERGGAPPPEYAGAHELATRIDAAMPARALAPCHDDLLTANLIRDERGTLLLVDWEYAGMGEPFFDLGNLSVNNDFDAAADELLLSAYCGEPPTSARRASLQLMRVMSDVREAAWGVVQSALSELDFDFGAYAQRHFERLAAAAADARFEEWLRAAPA